MILVTYMRDGHDHLAILADGILYNTDQLHPDLPSNMHMFLTYWDEYLPIARSCLGTILQRRTNATHGFPADGVELLAPIPFPGSLREAQAFSGHVEAITRASGGALPQMRDRHPAIAFGNHQSIRGPGDVSVMPDHLRRLDFGMQVCALINRPCRDVTAGQAEECIAGLMIMNGFAARTLQVLGSRTAMPTSVGRDFANTVGPWLVTLDELEPYAVPAGAGHRGRKWKLDMHCRINGEPVAHACLSDMDWTFAELVELASYGVTLMPGDIIGSGPSVNGSLLALNGGLADESGRWLREGDTVEISVEALGVLTNRIRKAESEHTILRGDSRDAEG